MNKKILGSILLVALVAAFSSLPFTVLLKSTVNGGHTSSTLQISSSKVHADDDDDDSGGGSSGGATSIKSIIDSAKGNLTGLGASLAAIAFIVSGIMYLTATGNPGRMTIAKGCLIAGVVGIVIILLANNACTFVNTFFSAGGKC